MAIVNLTVSPREVTGKNANRRLRASGQIPGVIYGHGEPIKVTVNARAFVHALSEGDGERSILKLTGVPGSDNTVIIRDVQRDPVYHQKLVHVDFGRVRMDEVVAFTIPVHTKGLAPGVKLGGILTQSVRMLDVQCTPANVPHEIVVDISGLKIGDGIIVKDLNLPEGVVPSLPEDEMVVSVIAKKIVEDEEEGDEGEGDEAAEPEVIGKGKDEEEDSE